MTWRLVAMNFEGSNADKVDMGSMTFDLALYRRISLDGGAFTYERGASITDGGGSESTGRVQFTDVGRPGEIVMPHITNITNPTGLAIRLYVESGAILL